MNETIYEKVSELIGQLRYNKGVLKDMHEATSIKEIDRLLTDLELSTENIIQDAVSIENKMEEEIASE